jgi:tetratricopeptide (TPR) repeat protein
VNIAQAALGARNMELAQTSIEEAFKKDPNSIETLKLAVTISEKMGHKEKRTEYLRRWRKLDPDNPEAVAKVADDYIIKSRYAVARPLVEHLVKLVPEFGPAYSMRGHILIEMNPTSRDLQQAEKDFLKALRSNPDDYVSRYFLGRTYLLQKRYQEAVSQFEAVDHSGQSKNDPTYLLQLARTYQAMGNTQKAAAVRRRYAPMVEYQNKLWEYKSRLNVAPDDVESYVKLGLLLLNSDEPLGAENYLSRATQLRPNDPQVKAAQQQLEEMYSSKIEAGLAALEKRQYKKADELISQAMMLRPHDPRTQLAVQQAREAVQMAATPPKQGSVPGWGASTPLHTDVAPTPSYASAP